MIKIKKPKKAELSTQQIVLLIILIASFIIILFFLFRLNPGEESEKEACHQSVVMRGNTAIPSEAIPLKCSTKYLCISKDGTCEGLTKPVLEKVKTKEEIYDVLAEEMVDCWWMFGEGKLNYVGKDMKPNLYCSICTQFILDDSLNEIEGVENGKVDERDFYQYLEKKQLESEGMTYLEYLTGSKVVASIERGLASRGGTFRTYDLGKQHYVMMGIYSKVGVSQWAGIGLAAGAIIAAPFTSGTSLGYFLVGGSALGGAAAGGFLGKTIKGESGDEYLTPFILEANSREFEAFNCKDVMTVA
jgi:hypothetical protein